MGNENQDKLLCLYSRLLALKENLSKASRISENFVRDYHSIVDEIAQIAEINLDEFKIPMSKVKPDLAAATASKKFYTKNSFCGNSLFFSKMDAFLSYFQIKYLSKEQPQMGFTYKEE